MTKKLLEILSDKKNFLFLLMCLAVHGFNAVLFWSINILPLCYLNCVSTFFYILVILIFKKNNDILIIITYFEIIIFSLLSEFIAGGKFYYIDFVIGMIACVFYLLPSEKKLKHIYQSIGVIFAVIIYSISVNNFYLFPELQPLILKYTKLIGYINLGITLFTLFYISNLYLIDLNQAREKLNYTSNHDALTGLYNRRFFESVMKRNKDEKENCFSIAMFDVDNFKKVNDTYGHEAGDLVLEMLSTCISDNAPAGSITVRWGGEEFILYMPQTDGQGAMKILKNITGKITDRTIDYNGTLIKITVTVGVCTARDISDYQSVIREADEKLYWGKTHGKNQIVSGDYNDVSKQKRIVVYFSHAGDNYGVGEVDKGNTQVLAEYIAGKTWSEVFRIEEAVPYPFDFTECQRVAKEELVMKKRPAIKGELPDLSDYGTIYLGFPNWWGDLPMCVYTFLEKYELRDKIIRPFCTHEGNGFDSTIEKLKEAVPLCKVSSGFEITGTIVKNNPSKMEKLVNKWIEN